MDIRLPNNWAPRAYQRKAWTYLRNGGKRAALCWARRHGKDDLSLHYTAIAAHERVGSYWHLLPEQAQARKAIWTQVNPHTGLKRIDEAFPVDLRARTNDQEMFIEFKNGSTWQIAGSDNYNSLVGSSPCGIVFSEYALANPASWAYLRPILRENKGWAIFISTPRGRNHFYHMIQLAKKEADWFGEVVTCDESHLLSQEELAADLRELQAEHGDTYGHSIWMQENFCSFDAAIPGAIWADSLDRVQLAGRIVDFEHTRAAPVFTGWDLGRTDDTAIWFYQFNGADLDVIDYWAGSGYEVYDVDVPDKSIAHVLLAKAREYGYTYAQHWLPHDARPRRLGMGGKSILQQFMDAKDVILKTHRIGLGSFAIAPRLDVQEGIQAARKTFQSCRFHATKCDLGLQALRHYHREWDADKKLYTDTPVHDWCLAEGTRILTPSGWRPVETLSIHDHVLTPLGTRRILRAGIVRMTDQWSTVKGIQTTPEHRFFTSRGLVEAGSLLSREQLWTRDSWGLRFLAYWCAILRLGFMDAITWATPKGGGPRKPACSFIGWSMRLCMGAFRTGMTSIIRMGMDGITTLTTWRPWRDSIIALPINQNLAFSASAESAAFSLDATKSSERRVLPPVSASGIPSRSESGDRSGRHAAPAYNITVDRDHCYFVRGDDGKAYLVSNSSHPADAWRTVGLTWRPSKVMAPTIEQKTISTRGWTFGEAKKHHFDRRRQIREWESLG